MKFLSFLVQIVIFYAFGMMLVRLVVPAILRWFSRRGAGYRPRQTRNHQSGRSRYAQDTVVDAEFEEVNEND